MDYEALIHAHSHKKNTGVKVRKNSPRSELESGRAKFFSSLVFTCQLEMMVSTY